MASRDAAGSSPLARGLLNSDHFNIVGDRIIPARAGFTRDISWKNPLAADHPRSRGVYWVLSLVGRPRPGSSPLARGLRRHDGLGPARGGIIPARAGFTRRGIGGRRRRPDHPRSRGVYDGLRVTLNSASGSSPLARGLPPRSAGMGGGSRGSSPLARGLRLSQRAGQRWRRIIPARAGFTRVTRMFRGPCWDHPRSRGVY